MQKFHNDWLQPEYKDNVLFWKLNLSPEQILSVDVDSLYDYSIEAAESMDLGENPAICFSGGIDSQIMLQCFLRSSVKFNVIIMRFEDDLNLHDIKTATEFCSKHNISYTFLDLNVIDFLENELPSFANQYNVSSPQFATHFKMFLMLKELGYTSAIAAGNPPSRTDKGWFRPGKEQTDWIEFSDKIQWKINGDFLSYHWKLALLLACLYKHEDKLPENFFEARHQTYLYKTRSYLNAKFDLIPQETKLTGFEKIKDYYQTLTGDGWTFEKKFRMPLNRMHPPAKGVIFDATTEQLNALDELYDRCAHLRNNF